jgi:Meckel syndrome type 1 protein
MPGMTPLRRDEVRSARAWAAFVADDATATPRPSLEARVLRAAHAAMAQKQRDDAERRRRQWFAGCTALAASVLAASAWSLAPHGPITAAATTPDSPTATRPESSVVRSHDTGSIGATSPESSTPSTPELGEAPGRPVAMTNVEAGRVLASPPRRLLASRPLFDPADGASPVDAPARLRAKSFGAPTVEPAFTNGRPKHSIPDPTTPALAAAPPLPRSALAPAVAATSSEVWSSRSFDGVFDPEAGKKPVPPPIRLDQAAPKPAPREDPPAPPL